MSQWENPLYQQYLDESDKETDPVKRKELFRKAERLLMDEMPVVPICFSTINYVTSKKLKKVFVSSGREVEFRYATIAEAEE